ncbi:MAG: hypothetical protein H0W61_02400 [Bacteroidetes bacterium]|nr:hypothetical protein [Bacteroidota bacterium]
MNSVKKMQYIYALKFFKHILVLCPAILLFNSCKNDLKLNAPYKETPSIYAVLNPQDKVNMIRINKVFLGESDANAMAQVSDSINYQPGELRVSLKRIVSNNYDYASPGLMEVVFRDSIIQAKPGAFNQNQRVYVTSSPLFTWGDYVLTVYNNHTKNTFTAKASALDSIHPYSYAPFIGVAYPVPPGTPIDPLNFVDYSTVGQTYKIRYKANSSKIYQLVMRLHYYDSLLNGNPPSYKNYTYADYSFSNQYSQDISTQGDLVNSFKGQDVFDAIGKAVSQVPFNGDVVGRRMYKIQFLIYTSSHEYSNYLQFAAPSLSINQEKHLYSNFDNSAAIGIFTFRTRCSVVKEMDNSFISAFATNKSTCSYKFFNATMNLPGCQ